VKNVDLSALKPKFIEKKIEELGDVKIDDLLVGMDGVVKISLKQVKIATMRQLILQAPGNGSIPGIPTTQYQSMYALAGLLNIHPTDMGSDTSEDFNIVKAAPVLTLPKSTEGKNTQDLDCDWMIYPDQTQFIASPPVLVYYYVGPVPS
jgi:hypothetical protein